MVDDLTRALGLEYAYTRAVADEVGLEPWGFDIRTASLPLVHDVNTPIVLHAAALPAGFADDHDRLRFDDDLDGTRMAETLGWPEHERHTVMVHRHEADRPPPDVTIEEVDLATWLPLEDRLLAAEGPPFDDEALREQLLERTRRTDAAVRTRYFIGEDAGGCKLMTGSGIWQVEDVMTLPEARGRGIARAAVTRALTEARAGGATLTFLVADEDDWPKQLYAKLGFEPVGRVHLLRRAT